jgi:transposase
MKNSNQVETAWYLYKSAVSPCDIAKQLQIHKATAYRWVKDFKHLGLERTLQKRSNCKARTQSRKINQIVKNRIYKIRREKHDCCGEKIQYYYKKEYGQTISISKIYQVLNEKYKLRSKYKKNKYGEAPKGITDRDVVQADTVDFGDVYAYTYVDTYNRQCFVDLELDLESFSGYSSLIAVSEVFGYINVLQTDGGPEFKGKFSQNILHFANTHRVSRPFKKNEQSFIESFNRTLRKECLGWGKYTVRELPDMIERVDEFMKFYNNERPHLGLGMRIPNEVASCRICG